MTPCLSSHRGQEGLDSPLGAVPLYQRVVSQARVREAGSHKVKSEILVKDGQYVPAAGSRAGQAWFRAKRWRSPAV